jgi:hypothetical protein
MTRLPELMALNLRQIERILEKTLATNTEES